MQKRLLVWVMTLAMLCSLLPSAGLTALAAPAEQDTTATVGSYTITVPKGAENPGDLSGTAPTEVTGSSQSWGAESTTTWYVVSGTVEINNTVTVNGAVNLILCDGAKLTVNGSEDCAGIRVTPDNSLTVYSGVSGTGELVAIGGGYNGAGIGGDSTVHNCGKVTINGGIVTAKTEQKNSFCAGIGGGENGNGGTVTINGGTVTATGGAYGAGIGGGERGYNKNGGNGGIVTVNGGTVTATGGHYGGAGIGGGLTGDGGTVTVNGGAVSAVGGGDNYSSYAGAGIGGGGGDWTYRGGAAGTVTINGGAVTATGGSSSWNEKIGAGIGSGSCRSEENTSVDTLFVSTAGLTVKAGDASADTVFANETPGTTNIQTVNNFAGKRFVTVSLTYREPTYNTPDSPDSGIKEWNEKLCLSFRDVTASDTEWTDGWYAVSGTVEINNTVTVTGNVNLILCDGAKLTVNNTISVTAGKNLTIYGQTAGTGELKALSGIDGGTGTVTICGGVVTATGSSNKAGITGGSVVLDSGTVTATGGSNGHGIAGSTTINGGTVKATGTDTGSGINGNVTINSGTVEVTGTGAGFNGDVLINGGFVKAMSDENGSGATNGTFKVASAVLTVKAGNNADTMQVVENTAPGQDMTGVDSQRYVTVALPYQEPTYNTPDSPISGVKEWNERRCGGYTEVTSSNDPVTWKDGWYVVSGTVAINNSVTVQGNVNLLLCDGAKLTVDAGAVSGKAGVSVERNNSLTVYTQTAGTGELVAKGGSDGAGIGSSNSGVFGNGTPCGKVTIHGGTVIAEGGGSYGAGIGGGYYGNGGAITINKGTVTATGKGTAAGIGGSYDDNRGGDVIVNGGTVTATGGAQGRGIGGGSGGRWGNENNNGSLYVNSSNLTVKAGDTFPDTVIANTNPGTTNLQDDSDLKCKRYVSIGIAYQSPTYNTPDDPASGAAEWNEKICPGYTQVTGNTMDWSNGWYVVTDDITISDTVTVTGDVNLLLCDGAKLTVDNSGSDKIGAGIRVESGNSLTVYSQTEGTGNLTAIGAANGAGIGGGDNRAGGTFTLNGGIVEAKSVGECGAGIGGGCSGNGGTVIVNGGTLNAEGGLRAAGIGGGGMSGAGGAVTVNAGEVTAVGGQCGAGIGGGAGGDGGNAVLNGGTVTATGGVEDNDFTLGAGIGGGGSSKNPGESTNVTPGTLKVASGLTLKAGESTPPTTVVANAEPGTTDLQAQGILQGMQYVILEKSVATSGGGSTTHPAKAAETDNGTVKLDKTNAKTGSTVTITVTPDEGYAVDTVTVTDKKGNPVAVTQVSEGKYTITMPNSEVTVVVAFKEAEETPGAAERFLDVQKNDWFYGNVNYVAEEGLMNGVSETEFDPNGTASRAMFITTLWRAAGSPVVNYAMPFTDVPEGEWFTEAIRWGASTEVVKGTSKTTFGTNEDVTREALGTMLYRYEQSEGNGLTGDWMFLLTQTDASAISSWADESMHWCVMKKVMQGDNNNKLNPQNKATRAELATILMNWDTMEK